LFALAFFLFSLFFCSYHGGDDVIAIKSGWDCFGYEYNHSTRDVVIRNVTAVYSEAAGCAIGSEMSGGMSNITISDCDFTQTQVCMCDAALIGSGRMLRAVCC
jgi:polygalacturonase